VRNSLKTFFIRIPCHLLFARSRGWLQKIIWEFSSTCDEMTIDENLVMSIWNSTKNFYKANPQIPS